MDLLMHWQGKDFLLGVLGNASFFDDILDVLNNGQRPVVQPQWLFDPPAWEPKFSDGIALHHEFG
jgi:hypothetical protein